MGILKDYVPRVIPGVVQRARVSLTSAQILALNATPVSLIPAPGAGKYISVDEIIGKVNSTGQTQYTGANAIEFRYTNGSGVKVTGDLAAAWLNSATTRVDKAVGVAVTTAVANAAVVVVVPTADPGAGTGTVDLDILYRVVTI
jgi:3-oxoacyl-ACP reductase-like protein